MSDHRNIEAEYRDDVRDMAQQIQDWAKDNDYPDCDRVMKYMHESLDGCGRVIYTQRAKECVMMSRNYDAYFTEFGGEGASDGDGIKWSLLAYCAFEADVIEELDSREFDLNADRPGYAEPDDDEEN